MDETTPRPWHVDHSPDGGRWTIKQNGPNYYLGEMKSEADAQLIVTAVNAHDEMLEALKGLAEAAAIVGGINSEIVDRAFAAIAKGEGRDGR